LRRRSACGPVPSRVMVPAISLKGPALPSAGPLCRLLCLCRRGWGASRLAGTSASSDRWRQRVSIYRVGLWPYSPGSGRQPLAAGEVERSGAEPVDSGPKRLLSPRGGGTIPVHPTGSCRSPSRASRSAAPVSLPTNAPTSAPPQLTPSLYGVNCGSGTPKHPDRSGKAP